MIFQLIVSIVIVILGLTIFFLARKYEKYQPDIKKQNKEYNLSEMLSQINEQNIHEEIETGNLVGKECMKKYTAEELVRKLNKKISQSPIHINNGNQIREINRSI
jgi:uncharacterized protein YxeA